MTKVTRSFTLMVMPYRSEHHAYPAVAWHALPELHRQIQDELKHTETSYTRFHSRIVSRLSHGQPFQDTQGG